MNKINIIFILVISILPFSLSRANKKNNEIRVLARIESTESTFKVLNNQSNQKVPFSLSKKKLESVIKDLKQNEDVILTGHITQIKIQNGENLQFVPVFQISDITPISLEKLGKMEDVKIEPKFVHFTLTPPYSPQSLSVSGKTIGAITLTASILLLKSLTNSKLTSETEKQSENLLIFSAGALATGSQIFEDLKLKK